MRTLLLSLLGASVLSGVVLAQAPASVPPQIDSGFVLSLVAALLGAGGGAGLGKHMAKEADRKATVAHKRVDEEETARQKLQLEVKALEIEQKRDHAEIEKLRDSRHDYIDKELSPRLLRYENSVEEQLERFAARLSSVEARPKG